MEREVGFVIGTIDYHGAVSGRVCEYTHTTEERISGHPWRWNLWEQCFHPVLGNYRLTDEERLVVMDWLETHGYIYEDKEKS